MMTATNIHYELADRVQGLSAGGIGAMLTLARRTGLIRDIDSKVHVLKRHLPYHESDHVLNIAFNIMAGGKRIEHIELRRNDEVYLDAVGAERVPDPTTAGDFCRRFHGSQILDLMDAINETRLRVWSEQPPEFFTQAIIEGDGTLVETDAECKGGVDIAYDGTWSYHPLVISLANTAEPLYLVNRSGNRPSQEQAELYFDKAISLCRRAGFQKILLRGDTKFTQCTHLDRWDGTGNIQFVFGMAATDNLKELADQLPAEAYSFLERGPRYKIKTAPRQQPERVKQQIVKERGFKTIHVLEEMVTEFEYCPVACDRSYRVIVLQASGDGPRANAAVRGVSLLLLYHERPRDPGRPGRVLGQRSLRPGEPGRPAQERRLRADDAGGRSGEQLGLHGDGQFGLEPEGLECLDDTAIAPACGQTPSRETIAVADGVRDVLCGDDPDALPDRAKWGTVDLPLAVVEPVARGLSPTGCGLGIM